jgi:predicted DNA-binding transcriptional regulator AlpA
LTLNQAQPAETPVLAFPPLLSDEEVARILVVTIDWVRSHADEIPGFERLGSYFRFRSHAVEQWLGGPDRLLVAEQVAGLLNVPETWVYANANELPGLLRLGRYLRFRPSAINAFLGGSAVAQ